MECREILRVMPQDIKDRIRHRLQKEDKEFSLAEEWVALTDPGYLRRRYESWSKMKQFIFDQIVAAFACRPFSWNQLKQLDWQEEFSESHLRFILLCYCEEGILFSFQQKWGEQIYVLPIDCYLIWKRILSPRFSKALVSEESLNYDLLAGSREQATIRMLRLLSAIAKKPPRITKQGSCHRADQSWLALMSGLDMREIPSWLELVIAFGLVTMGKDAIRMHADRVCAWLKEDNPQADKLLAAQWLSMKTNEPVEKLHAYAELLVMEQEDWVHVWAETANSEQSLKEAASDLADTGFIETLCDRDHLYVRKASMECNEAELYIMEDYEIIALLSVPYSILWELELISERKRDRSGNVYQLTPSSVNLAGQFGRLPEDMIQFLEQHAKYGVPDHIKVAIHDWQREELPHADDKNHIYPNQEMIKNCASMTDSKRERLPYIPSKRLPRAEELYPELDKLPRIWWSQSRSYHPSTKKEIFMKAIAWRAYVNLQNDRKEQLHFIPEKMLEVKSQCYVIGRSQAGKMRISIEDWKELQLILPGINDTNNSEGIL